VPFYRFQIEVNVPTQVVAERLRSIVREKPGFWESMAWMSRGPASPAFVGTVQDDSFKIRRDIRYRNSFLPLIRGRIVPTGTGTRVSVTMFLHPLVAVFMTCWLGIAGNIASASPVPLVPWGMCIFGVALTIGGFFPEALKAKRLISDVVDVRYYRTSSGQ